MPKEIYGHTPSQSGFLVAPIRGPFPDGDRQVDQSGTGHCRRTRRPRTTREGARRCSDIAREAGISEDGIYRLLRALASVGLFAEGADRRFKLTGMGKLLRSD